MTPDERDRLTQLEVMQRELIRRFDNMEQTVNKRMDKTDESMEKFDNLIAKASGGFLILTALGGIVGWVLTTLSKAKGLTG